jgi:hypothetical protein
MAASGSKQARAASCTPITSASVSAFLQCRHGSVWGPFIGGAIDAWMHGECMHVCLVGITIAVEKALPSSSVYLEFGRKKAAVRMPEGMAMPSTQYAISRPNCSRVPGRLPLCSRRTIEPQEHFSGPANLRM